MHVALIIDQERLRREQAMLHRVSAGLTEHGAQVTAIVPDDTAIETDDYDRAIVASAQIPTRMRVQPWMRKLRARQLASVMASGLPDVLYAVVDPRVRLS